MTTHQRAKSLKKYIESAFNEGRTKDSNAAHAKGLFLEDVVEKVFEALGWESNRPETSGRNDGGRDFELRCELFDRDPPFDHAPPYAYVEVEFRDKRVNALNTYKLITLMCRDRVSRGLFVSWLGPSPAARNAVKNNGVLIRWWNADVLLEKVIELHLEDTVRKLVRKHSNRVS